MRGKANQYAHLEEHDIDLVLPKQAHPKVMRRPIAA